MNNSQAIFEIAISKIKGIGIKNASHILSKTDLNHVFKFQQNVAAAVGVQPRLLYRFLTRPPRRGSTGLSVAVQQRSAVRCCLGRSDAAMDYVWSMLEDGYYKHGIRSFWLDASEPEYYEIPQRVSVTNSASCRRIRQCLQWPRTNPLKAPM